MRKWTRPVDRRAFIKAAAGHRRAFLKSAAAGAAAMALAGKARASGPPNIIVILCDDLGYGDLSCYGSSISTPNLDQMAQNGMRFTHFYSASPVCSPSRAALMTGRYGPRVGIPGVLDADATTGIPDTEKTIAQMLKPLGYATMCIGKWHLGSLPQFMPTNHGFDEFYGIPYSIDMWPRPLMHNLDIIEEPANLDTLTSRYTQWAVNYINQNSNRPFFLYLAHSFPHLPLDASRPFQGQSGQGLYGDVIQEIDASTGSILQALANNGIDSNTLIIFSSDHGPWYQGSSGGFRGRKGEIFEGGMRVPMIARFPGVIPSGKVCGGMATNLDILPTVGALTGASLPGNPLDGIDISQMLTGQQNELKREAFLYFNNVCLQAARLGPWKLHVARFNTLPYCPLPAAGLVNLPLTPELYNVVDDPNESHDRAARNPDVATAIQTRIANLIPTFGADVQASWYGTLGTSVVSTPAGALPVQAT